MAVGAKDQKPNISQTVMRRQAVLLLLLTALLWSSSGLFIKLIVWGPFSILSARSLIATIVFLIYLRRPKFRWTRLQFIGALAYVGAQLFFIIGTKLTAAANIIFLSYTSPLYIILFGYWLLRERPQRADWLSMVAIFTGMLLFFGDDLSLEGVRGNLFGALGGLSMGVLVLTMRRQKDGVPAQTILLGNLIGILIGFPAVLQETFSPTSLGILLFLGIFQIGLSFILYSIAIKRLPALESTLILTIEPILNPLWVFLVIGEVPGRLAFVGGILILGTVITRAIISSHASGEDDAPRKG
ncbi:MAG: EamA family transporter [Chloroflexi bacterium]|nr:EamA family transporter [Chloroflexota bacterium]